MLVSFGLVTHILTEAMQVPHSNDEFLDFFGLTAAAFDEFVKAWGWPRFRADQVRDWTYRKNVVLPDGMLNLSKADRQSLSQKIKFITSVVSKRQDSEDGTIKLLLTWPDGTNAETVMIPDADRR